MGWGTEFTADLYLNKRIFNNTYDLDDSIEELEESLVYTKNKLLYLLGIPPKDFDIEDDIFVVFNDILEWRDSIIDELRLLYIYKEHLENEEIKKQDKPMD